MASPDNVPKLRADYSSPTDKQSWQYSQQSISQQPSTQDRVAYLAKLRKDVSAMQKDINTFLTSKMDEEKRLAQANGNGNAKIDEAKEEDNYGEELDEQ